MGTTGICSNERCRRPAFPPDLDRSCTHCGYPITVVAALPEDAVTTITGLVNRLCLTVGRPDAVEVEMDGSGTGAPGVIARFERQGAITCDGERATFQGLISWLSMPGRIARVVLHPSSERYDVSPTADFTAEDE